MTDPGGFAALALSGAVVWAAVAVRIRTCPGRVARGLLVVIGICASMLPITFVIGGQCRGGAPAVCLRSCCWRSCCGGIVNDSEASRSSPRQRRNSYSVGSTVYDAAGQVVARYNANGNGTFYSYDAAGRQTKVTDALNHTATRTYNSRGRLDVALTDGAELCIHAKERVSTPTPFLCVPSVIRGTESERTRSRSPGELRVPDHAARVEHRWLGIHIPSQRYVMSSDPSNMQSGQVGLSWTASGAGEPVVVASTVPDRRAEGRTSCWEGEEMTDGPNPTLRKATEHEPGESP